MNGKMYLASWADVAPMVCYKVEWNNKYIIYELNSFKTIRWNMR